MTNLKQLESIQQNLMSQVEDDSQKRKLATLEYLLNPRNYQSEERLDKVISIPKHAVDTQYLTEILEQLGYSNPQYEEAYDGYYEGTCYKITL